MPESPRVTRVSPRWEDPRTVAGFVNSSPNLELLKFAQARVDGSGRQRALDIGCGAARNTIPLAELGYAVVGTDLAAPMLDAAGRRASEHGGLNLDFVLAPMAPLPFAAATFDLVVAHGIWNLARSAAEFRAAVAEAARVARPGAGLFLFTFSRHTLPAEAQPDAGESFVFSSWNGEPQCFLREDELVKELGRAGFEPAVAAPFTEYNLPAPGRPRISGPPVIYEGTFRRC